MTAKVSVAMCTFNGERYVSEQLRSIAEQTRLPDELIIFDDHSTDSTITLLHSFAEHASFPVLIEINERNYGSTKNFERAIDRCGGDIIFLADQDDFWFPKKIARIEEEFLRSEDVGLVFSDAKLVDEDRNPIGMQLWDISFPEHRRTQSQGSAFYKTLLKGSVVTGATAAFRSGFKKDIIPVPKNAGNLIHDGWIAFVISLMADVIFVDEPLILYRLHSAQQIGVKVDSRLYKVTEEGLAGAIEEARRHRTNLEEMLGQLDRFALLRDRSDIERSIQDNLDTVAGQIMHLENRLRILKHEGSKFSIIREELRSGRYRFYSKGWLSAIKDLLA